MKKLASFLALVFVGLAVLTGCDQQPTPPEKPDVSAIIANATELREEKLFLATLKFKKEQLTLSPWKHIKNAVSAEHRTLIVDERTFNEYQIGEKVSSKGDGWGFVFKGEIARYTVRPTKKEIESQYFWADKSGTQTEITDEQYYEAVQQLSSGGRQLLTIPFSGVVRTYVLEKPLTEYQFVDRQPLNRYFVTIQVKNSSFSLNPTKHIRNAANTHNITIEVPREVYEKTGDNAWDTKLNTGSLIIKGHLSALRGEVVKKWSELDNGYQLVKTAEDQQFIIPKN